MKRRAVFLDRDGVLAALVCDRAAGLWEGPRRPDEAALLDGAAQAVKDLRAAGFLVFVVSNQPNYAKGKSSLEDLRLVHEKIVSDLAAAGAGIDEFFYCYHHPSGDKPGYSVKCACRKPEPYFLLKAAEKYGLDLERCWMVGDRASDIECGLAAGTKTVFVKSRQSGEADGAKATARAAGVGEAAELILRYPEDR